MGNMTSFVAFHMLMHALQHRGNHEDLLRQPIMLLHSSMVFII